MSIKIFFSVWFGIIAILLPRITRIWGRINAKFFIRNIRLKSALSVVYFCRIWGSKLNEAENPTLPVLSSEILLILAFEKPPSFSANICLAKDE